MTTDEAIDAIRNAPDRLEAARIRNDVATEAASSLRPEADADACREAFFDRWGHELTGQRVAPRPPVYFTGD